MLNKYFKSWKLKKNGIFKMKAGSKHWGIALTGFT